MASRISLTQLENGLDSIRLMAKASGSKSISGLKEVLVWGWHAVGILATVRLGSRKDLFDPWVQQYFEEGEPDIDPARDIHWDLRAGLSYLEILDLLSAEDLPLLKPDFYQGWQDRISRSRVLRGKARSILGRSITGAERDDLLFLLAASYRLTRLPAHVSVEVEKARAMTGRLCDLLDMFVPDDTGEWRLIRAAIASTRKKLRAKTSK